MSEEEILRKKLDRIHENSTYGLNAADQTYIANIIHSYIVKKKEETQMKATSTETFHDIIAIDFELQTFPNPDTQDKFIVSATNRDDIFAFVFEGPNLRYACRNAGLFVGWEKDQKIKELEKELKISKDQTNRLDKENDWLRKNYMTVAKDEAQKEAYKLKQENEKLTIEKAMLEEENEKLKTRINILTDSFTGCEKDQKIRELEEINKNLKKHVQYHIDDKDKLIKRIYELKKELALEKAANEAQHKFVREYAGKGTEVQFNYAIDDAKEVSYVIVEKNRDLAEENEKLKQENENLKKHTTAKALEYIEINHKLQDENEELKYQLMDIQATKEVVEEKLNTREGILDQAKKCVCGQREQDYGTPESNFQLIADLWNDYLYPTLGYPKKDAYGIKAEDVAMMMALMKIARIRNGGGSGDSFVDLAGYAACGGEIWALQKETN